MKDIIVLLFNSANGIYIPQMFSEQCNPENSFWVWSYEKFKSDLSSPDNEFYCEAWEDVVDTAYYQEHGGKKYFLYEHDGDLWAVAEGYSFDEFGNLIENETSKIIEL